MDADHPCDYQHPLADGRIQCDLCPRACALREGQAGLCFIRARKNDRIVLTAYGRAHGFCIDPIEKKPLNHFYPGSAVLSFGTAGCNLSCSFCQNWDMSKSRQMDSLAEEAAPQTIATAAAKLGCKSVAYTYNDPVIFLEYMEDCALACHQQGVQNVVVTAGYISPAPRERFFRHIDAANVDLKAFSERFYRNLCGGQLAPVLDTLCYIAQETQVWLELTTLLIPGENDSDAELHALCDWVVEHLGADVPIHFTAFHPDWKLLDRPATPAATLTRARTIAMEHGIRFAFTGNVRDALGNSSCCPQCGQRLIERDGYRLGQWNLTPQGACNSCGLSIPGRFDPAPGDWGAGRRPLRLSDPF